MTDWLRNNYVTGQTLESQLNTPNCVREYVNEANLLRITQLMHIEPNLIQIQ
jgi:hypothetical protein